jgi:hypothetical protein
MGTHLHWIAVLTVIAAAFASSCVVSSGATSVADAWTRLFSALLAAGVATAALGGIIGTVLALTLRGDWHFGLAVGLAVTSWLIVGAALIHKLLHC